MGGAVGSHMAVSRKLALSVLLNQGRSAFQVDALPIELPDQK